MGSAWIGFLSIFIINSWESSAITRINNRQSKLQDDVVRNFRHIEPPSTYINSDWETGLREATNQALLREKYHTHNLRDRLLGAPLLGKQNVATPFGDIAIVARGQLLVTNDGDFVFVQDPHQNDCEGCHVAGRCARSRCEEQGHTSHSDERLVALWTVKRLRHRDYVDGYRYETEYTISPVGDHSHARNHQIDYAIPGHVFVVKHDTETVNSPSEARPTIVYNRRIPHRHFTPEVLIGVGSDGRKHFLHSYPGFYTSFPVHPTHQSTNDPREIELYNALIEALASKTSTTKIIDDGPHKFSLNHYNVYTTKDTFTSQTPLVQLSTSDAVPHSSITETSPVTNIPIRFPTTHQMMFTKPTNVVTQEIYSQRDTEMTKPVPDVTQPVTTVHYFVPAGEEHLITTEVAEEMEKITTSTQKTTKPRDEDADFLFPIEKTTSTSKTTKKYYKPTAATTKFTKPGSNDNGDVNVFPEQTLAPTRQGKIYHATFSAKKTTKTPTTSTTLMMNGLKTTPITSMATIVTTSKTTPRSSRLTTTTATTTNKIRPTISVTLPQETTEGLSTPKLSSTLTTMAEVTPSTLTTRKGTASISRLIPMITKVEIPRPTSKLATTTARTFNDTPTTTKLMTEGLSTSKLTTSLTTAEVTPSTSTTQKGSASILKLIPITTKVKIPRPTFKLATPRARTFNDTPTKTTLITSTARTSKVMPSTRKITTITGTTSTTLPTTTELTTTTPTTSRTTTTTTNLTTPTATTRSITSKFTGFTIATDKMTRTTATPKTTSSTSKIRITPTVSELTTPLISASTTLKSTGPVKPIYKAPPLTSVLTTPTTISKVTPTTPLPPQIRPETISYLYRSEPESTTSTTSQTKSQSTLETTSITAKVKPTELTIFESATTMETTLKSTTPTEPITSQQMTEFEHTILNLLPTRPMKITSKPFVEPVDQLQPPSNDTDITLPFSNTIPTSQSTREPTISGEETSQTEFVPKKMILKTVMTSTVMPTTEEFTTNVIEMSTRLGEEQSATDGVVIEESTTPPTESNFNDGTDLMKSTTVSESPSKSASFDDFFLEDANKKPSSKKPVRVDYTDDDIFGSIEEELKPTMATVMQVTESEFDRELFGDKRESPKEYGADSTLAGTKIIFSGFYEASTVSMLDNTEKETSSTEDKPLTKQSYATSISFKVNKKNKTNVVENEKYGDATTILPMENVTDLTTKMTIRNETIGTEMKKAFDEAALQLVNHVRSINYLNRANNGTRKKYKRRRNYIPKSRKTNTKKKL